MARRDPIVNPKAIRCNVRSSRFEPLLIFTDNERAIDSDKRANGMAIMCACKSANRKVKNGNSVISKPRGFPGGIILLLRQKSNCPKG